MKIGFIGLGIMGGRMAANLLKNGADLTIYNRTKAKASGLLEEGAKWAEDLSNMSEMDIVFTMLAHPEAVTEMAIGANGFLNHLRPGKIWVDCSTVNPSFSRMMADEAAARNIKFIDAPVAGTKPQAQNGELVFITGGNAEDIETCRPFFEMMGSRVAHMGENGKGASLKVVVNLMLAQTMAAFAESVALGESLGISQEVLFNTLMGGPVVPPFVASKRDMMTNNVYEDPQFPLRWMQKDVQMAAVSAYETGISMPIANVTKEIYQMATQAGFGDQDFSAIYSFLKGKNG
ncbi:MAG: NAD(P)-dependent oxidoreductase [Chloroflexota bacterium]